MKTSLTKKVLLTAGVLGAAWAVWRAAQSKENPIVRHLVGQEMASHRVRETQQLLQRLGYNLFADGVAGRSTREALKKFQSLHDLDVDGEVGRDTLDMLRAEVHALGYSRSSFAGFGPMASGAITPNSIGLT